MGMISEGTVHLVCLPPSPQLTEQMLEWEYQCHAVSDDEDYPSLNASINQTTPITVAKTALSPRLR